MQYPKNKNPRSVGACTKTYPLSVLSRSPNIFRALPLLLLWLLSWPSSGTDISSPSAPSPSNQEFLDRFWQRPLPKQGTARISPDLSDRPPLSSETCRLCHPRQYADWTGSRHAQAMGPGAIGQFFPMSEEERQACLDCHAPLHEQSHALTQYLDDSQWEASREHSAIAHAKRPLHEEGVTCGVCHIRAGRWHGPPRRRDPLSPEIMAAFPHRGWVSTDAFEDSRFCAACHQFPPDGLRLDGKLLEDTYREWRASPQARQGMHCQTCHMPDRRHLFRGIHDPATARKGTDAGSMSFSVSKGAVSVLVFLANTGTGHRLPTYVTPAIRLEAYQSDANGASIPGTREIQWVARSVNLDLTKEYFDTRLSPGQTATLAYQKPRAPRADTLVTRVYVEPDALYTRIYEALLELEPDGEGAVLLREALAESKASGFPLYEKRYLLPKDSPARPESQR
uniref:Cytochrome c554 and c-prime n=1 Tax=Candidatus Kentrum sp. UNK TaxID=2126344 RepID=A0A451AMD7_9GAMM|nr:MAG: Cytochrome c554 and c-prime [Candidatus Kentron sp. UNK]VFK72704.1 MAG: Cytochrome c554 and c-prime [Candidatus Kentron sp. UNK]